jgi:hypothetical protein
METKQEMDLVKRLNKNNKYTNEYVLSVINHKRMENMRMGKNPDDGIEKIDLNIEYASVRADTKYNKEWIEKQVKK